MTSENMPELQTPDHFGVPNRLGWSNTTRSADLESIGKKQHSIVIFDCPRESCPEQFEVEADVVQHMQVVHGLSDFDPHDAHKYETQTPIPSSQPQRTSQWFCFHCTNGPMLTSLSAECTNCHRPRDRYSKVEQHQSYSWRRIVSTRSADYLSAYSMFDYEPQSVQCMDIRSYEDGLGCYREMFYLWSQGRSIDYVSLRLRAGRLATVDVSCCLFRSPGSRSFSIVLTLRKDISVALLEPSARVLKSTSNYDGQQSISTVFKVGVHATGHYTLSVSRDENTQTTSVLILAQSRYHSLGRLLRLLTESQALYSQPLLIPSLVVALVMNLTSEKIEFANHRINVFEEDLGQHTYVTRRLGDPLKIDFTLTTRSLNSQSTTLGINEMRLNAILLVSAKVEAYSKIYNDMSKNKNAQVIKDALLCFEEHVEHLQIMCRHLLLRNSYEQKLTQTQLAVVYNFMAQKDNLLTIDIAAASKRDSSAMKTIAFVTMVFLPGTFVAAFFSIPIFDWKASEGSSIIGPNFYIYWATTIPLTFSVLLTWLLLPSFNQWTASIARSEVFGASQKQQKHGHMPENKGK